MKIKTTSVDALGEKSNIILVRLINMAPEEVCAGISSCPSHPLTRFWIRILLHGWESGGGSQTQPPKAAGGPCTSCQLKDVQWRVVHWATATTDTECCASRAGEECIVCSQTLIHIYVRCPWHVKLFNVLLSWLFLLTGTSLVAPAVCSHCRFWRDSWRPNWGLKMFNQSLDNLHAFSYVFGCGGVLCHVVWTGSCDDPTPVASSRSLDRS